MKKILVFGKYVIGDFVVSLITNEYRDMNQVYKILPNSWEDGIYYNCISGNKNSTDPDSWRLATEEEKQYSLTYQFRTVESLNINSKFDIKANTITFNFNDETPILQLKDNGDILVKGKLIENDIEVVNALREFVSKINK